MATIEERGDSFRVNWRLGGSRAGARQSVTFPGGTWDARNELAQAAKNLVKARSHDITRDEVYAAILGRAPAVVGRVPTFKEWVETWASDRERLKEVQPDTLARYRRIMKARVVPEMGHLRLTDITEQTIRDWVAKMVDARRHNISKRRGTSGKPLAAQTVRRAHAILHQCLGAAVPRWIPANPAARPAGARKHTSGLPKVEPFDGMFLTRQEVQLILDSCSPQIRDLVLVAVRTGMRLGELVALDVRHVVLTRNGGYIRVRRALKDDGVVGPPKSLASRRDVTVPPVVAKVLAARVAGKRPGDLVFPAPKGAMWNENNLRQRHWLPAVAAAQRCVEHPPPVPPKPVRGPVRKLRFTEVSTCTCSGRLTRAPRFHDLRHTHASALISKGVTPKKVQVRLGHASFLTTMNIYGHLWDSGNTDELAGIDAFFDGRPPVRGSHHVVARRKKVSVLRRRLQRT